MTSFILYLKTLYRKCNRKSYHRRFIFDRKFEIRNNLVRMLLDINTDSPIKVIRKARKIKSDKNSYVICKITEEDLHLLTQAKFKLKLVKKYRRRLLLMEF